MQANVRELGGLTKQNVNMVEYIPKSKVNVIAMFRLIRGLGVVMEPLSIINQLECKQNSIWQGLFTDMIDGMVWLNLKYIY